MKQHVADAFEKLAAAYPSWAGQYNAAKLEIWAGMLEDLERDRLLEAVERLIKSSKFAPSIAEIRETVAAIQHENRHGGRTISEIIAEAKLGGVH